MFLKDHFADLMKLPVLLRQVEKIKEDWSCVVCAAVLSGGRAGGDKNKFVTL